MNKFKTNPFAKKLKAKNADRNYDQESVDLIKKSTLWRWNGEELVPQDNTPYFAVFIVGIAVGILMVHEVIIKVI